MAKRFSSSSNKLGTAGRRTGIRILEIDLVSLTRTRTPGPDRDDALRRMGSVECQLEGLKVSRSKQRTTS